MVEEDDLIGRAGLLLATLCSLSLTWITLSAPRIPADWPRPDANGVSIPQPILYPWTSYGLQAILWIGVVGGLLLNTQRKKRNTEIKSHREATHRYRATEGRQADTMYRVPTLLWLALITLVGFGLRVHTLDRLPLILDEIGFAAHASDILHGQQVPIFAPGHNANPSVYSWLVAGAMALFGQNPFAIRLLPLVFGTLSIPAVYILGRAWWGRRIGLLAAAFLATYPAHIFYSRLSLYNVIDPFFAMLALAFLPHPLTPSPYNREGEQSRWILAGILAGVAQYFYHGSRLVMVLMAVYIGLSAVSRHRSAKNEDTNYRVPTGLIVWMMMAFGLVALPRYAPLLVGGLPLTGNAETMRLPADFGANSLRAVLAWVGQPDKSPFWLSETPLLAWGALLAFVIGLAICIRHIRDPRSIVLLTSFLLTTIFGGAIWTAAPLYVRYMTAVPAIALLVAIGIEAVSRQWSAIREKIQSKDMGVADRYSEHKNGKRTGRALSLHTLVILLICLQGIITAWQQSEEAYQRITNSQWQEMALAQTAASLPQNLAVIFIAPTLDAVQQITFAHAVAAYGERRAVTVVSSSPDDALSDRSVVIRVLDKE